MAAPADLASELAALRLELSAKDESLQTANQELATVNNELQAKLTDLARANNDMNNLLAGTGIATVFVDHAQNILRFTPAATEIINLIQSDVNRPVGHIVSNLVGYNRLVQDVQTVLNTLVPVETEVQTHQGQWYTMHIKPYRTLENVIEGAVISFVDISEAVHTRETLHQANGRLRLAVVVHDARDAITLQNLEGQTLAWNPGATRMYGWSEAEALGMNVCERIPVALWEEALSTLYRLCQAETLAPYCTQRLTRNGEIMDVSITSTALINPSGQVYGIATTERARHTP